MAFLLVLFDETALGHFEGDASLSHEGIMDLMVVGAFAVTCHALSTGLVLRQRKEQLTFGSHLGHVMVVPD